MNGIELLDPQIAALADTVPIRTISADTLPELRAQPLFAPIELSGQVDRTDHQVSADPDVTVRVHRHKSASGPLPCVYSIHGGGYVVGSYESDDAASTGGAGCSPASASLLSTGWPPRLP